MAEKANLTPKNEEETLETPETPETETPETPEPPSEGQEGENTPEKPPAEGEESKPKEGEEGIDYKQRYSASTKEFQRSAKDLFGEIKNIKTQIAGLSKG